MEEERQQPEFLNEHPTQNFSIHDKFLLLKARYLRLVYRSNNRKRSLRSLNHFHTETRFAIKGLRQEIRDRDAVIKDASEQIVQLKEELKAATAHV